MKLRFLLILSLAFLTACATSSMPVPESLVDSDADGVIDALDRCPDTQVGLSVDAHGCPSDSDQDGVFDELDRCPNSPAGYAVDSNGCPLDSDADGVDDLSDRCPETAAGIVVDANGCARPIAPLPPEQLVMRIGFRTDSAKVSDEYSDLFARGAAFIRAHSSCSSVIEGHADSVGTQEYNHKLSLRRAEAVRAKLVDAVAAPLGKLEVAGFGEERPLADNGTSAGRQQNRRAMISITCEPRGE
jgi:OmpA-OmpF porin, OOP family